MNDRLARAVERMHEHERVSRPIIEDAKRRFWVAEGRKQAYREMAAREEGRRAARPWFLRWLP